MKSIPNDKKIPNAIDELQKAIKKMELENAKQIQRLQQEWKAQIKSITMQYNEILKAMSTIAKSTPNISAFNQALKTLEKMNTPSEIAKAVSKMNTNLGTQFSKSLKLNLSNEVAKAFENYNPSKEIAKAFENYNPSEAMIKVVKEMNSPARINEMMEKFQQEWKSKFDDMVRQYPEKRILKRVEVEDDDEYETKEDENGSADEETNNKS